MSKMREALEEAAVRGFNYGLDARSDVPPSTAKAAVNIAKEIAQRYGPLEFTREEVQKIGYRILEAAANRSEFYPGLSLSEMIEQIVSHHTEAEGRCCCSCEEPEHSRESYGEKCLKCGKHRPPNGKVNFVDDTPTIKASEIERVTGEKVPEEYEWGAVDADGKQYAYIDKPWKGSNEWLTKHPKALTGLPRIIPGPWQDSLRRIIHDEPEEEPDLVDAVLDYRTREGMATLDDLCKRVAAIENRLLADGHSRKCEYAVYLHGECTCGHDKIRENAK